MSMPLVSVPSHTWLHRRLLFCWCQPKEPKPARSPTNNSASNFQLPYKSFHCGTTYIRVLLLGGPPRGSLPASPRFSERIICPAGAVPARLPAQACMCAKHDPNPRIRMCPQTIPPHDAVFLVDGTSNRSGGSPTLPPLGCTVSLPDRRRQHFFVCSAHPHAGAAPARLPAHRPPSTFPFGHSASGYGALSALDCVLLGRSCSCAPPSPPSTVHLPSWPPLT